MRHPIQWLAAIAVLATLILTALPGTASAASATVKIEANLRVQPNTTSPVRAVLAVGTPVEVVCWASGEPTFGTDKYGSMWLSVAGGWIHSFMVTSVEVPPCTSGGALVYNNCDEARAAGAAPVVAGQRGYGLHLDRDHDGIGCE